MILRPNVPGVHVADKAAVVISFGLEHAPDVVDLPDDGRSGGVFAVEILRTDRYCGNPV